MARTTALSIYRGEDITLNFTQYTTDTGSTAEDITGWTLVFNVAREENSATKLITKSGTILVAASGTFRVTLLAADTADIQPARYYWDVWRTDSGYARLLGEGAFNITASARLPPAA